MQKCMNLLIPYIEPAYAASESNLCKLRSRIRARDDLSSVFVNEASSEDGITSRVHYLLISACIIWYLVRHNMHYTKVLSAVSCMCRDHDQGRDDDDDDDDDDMAGSRQNTVLDLPRSFHQLRLNNNFDVLSHLCVYLRKRLFSFFFVFFTRPLFFISVFNSLIHRWRKRRCLKSHRPVKCT